MTFIPAQPSAHVPATRDRRISSLVAPLVAALAWSGVAYIELVRLPKDWVLIYAVPPFEATVWLVAAMATIYLAKTRLVPSVTTRAAVAIAMAVLMVHFNNWAFVEPRSYYATHRGSFEHAAELVRAGEVGKSDEYYGEKLPRALIDLSADGNASVVGQQDGKPVVFLPQWLGIPDDAGGYIYYDGELRSDTEVDLYGRLVGGSEMRELGNGWWYA